MRREVELLFDSIVREDRSVVSLLDADYTFVNERLAKHYGIRNIYGSQFRRVTLGPEFDVRKGLLGKGAILSTTAKPERNSPVTRGKWVMTNILGVPPPDPPPERSAASGTSQRRPRKRCRSVDAAEDAGASKGGSGMCQLSSPDGSHWVHARKF